MSENSKEPIYSPVRAIWDKTANYLRSLPEPVRIGIGVSVGLSVLVVPFLVYLLHEVVLRAFVLLLRISFALLVLLVCVAGYRFAKNKREKKAIAFKEAQKAQERAELQRLNQRSEIVTAILEGKVKPLTDSGPLLLRNSEALWYSSPAQVLGKRGEVHVGDLHVTSLRLVFTCPDFPLDIPIGHVNAIDAQGYELLVTARTANYSQSFQMSEPDIVAAHVRRSVLAYHRQVDVGFESDMSRRIPQDVKTSVFQRDAGRCVQCGASDYLEYDHIIPFSKGGASTVDNLQLLCRRCNLRKGNSI